MVTGRPPSLRGTRRRLAIIMSSRSSAAAAPPPPASKRTIARSDKAALSVSNIVERLLALEDATPWDAVKNSWAYKQKAWLQHVSELVGNDDDAAVRRVKELIQDFSGALKPKALAPWWCSAAQSWVSRCADATSAGALVPVLDALSATITHGDAPAWLDVPKLLVDADAPAVKLDDHASTLDAPAVRARTGKQAKVEAEASEPMVKMEVDETPADGAVDGEADEASAPVPVPTPAAASGSRERVSAGGPSNRASSRKRQMLDAPDGEDDEKDVLRAGAPKMMRSCSVSVKLQRNGGSLGVALSDDNQVTGSSLLLHLRLGVSAAFAAACRLPPAPSLPYQDHCGAFTLPVVLTCVAHSMPLMCSQRCTRAAMRPWRASLWVTSSRK